MAPDEYQASRREGWSFDRLGISYKHTAYPHDDEGSQWTFISWDGVAIIIVVLCFFVAVGHLLLTRLLL